MTAAVPGSAVPGIEPLAGYTIGITAARRREEFGVALQRRGAKVMYGPAIRIVPLDDDRGLRAATERCLSDPLDIVVATTGIGFRGWMEAADAWASRRSWPRSSAGPRCWPGAQGTRRDPGHRIARSVVPGVRIVQRGPRLPDRVRWPGWPADSGPAVWLSGPAGRKGRQSHE